MQRITKWELHTLGVEWSDYFPGFGTGQTYWQRAACGIGHSEHEAAEECLEQIAMSNDCDIPPELQAEVDKLSTRDELEAYTSTEDTPWVHFGIRYNTEEIA